MQQEMITEFDHNNLNNQIIKPKKPIIAVIFPFIFSIILPILFYFFVLYTDALPSDTEGWLMVFMFLYVFIAIPASLVSAFIKIRELYWAINLLIASPYILLILLMIWGTVSTLLLGN